MDDGLPPNLDSKTFSNDLGKFFVQKIDTIRTQVDIDQQTDSYLEDDTLSADETVPPFPTFMMLSVQDVKQLIQNSTLKSALLTLCHPHRLANVRIFSQFSQILLTPYYSLDDFLKFGKRLKFFHC